LTPERDGFGRRQLDDLIDHATHLMRASSAPVDAIRIVPSTFGN
jgi:hypothetical protein